MKNIGIYAGTFDPLHEGHLEFAKASLDKAQLDEVVFLPERHPRRKENVTPYTQRCEQIELTLSSLDRLSLLRTSFDAFDVKTTLPWLKSLYPKHRLTFLFGSDIVSNMKTWNEIETMLENVSLVIGLRDNANQEAIENELIHLQKTTGASFHFDIIKTQASHLSSSMFRTKSQHKD